MRALTPAQRINAECGRRGRSAVVAGCIALLEGREVDPGLIVVLGGRPASWVASGEVGGPPYWLRVWAARGLLWAWEPQALPALLTALADEAWRVREMAVKVVARYHLDEALPVVADLRRADPTPRVRVAAARALIRLTGTDGSL